MLSWCLEINNEINEQGLHAARTPARSSGPLPPKASSLVSGHPVGPGPEVGQWAEAWRWRGCASWQWPVPGPWRRGLRTWAPCPCRGPSVSRQPRHPSVHALLSQVSLEFCRWHGEVAPGHPQPRLCSRVTWHLLKSHIIASTPTPGWPRNTAPRGPSSVLGGGFWAPCGLHWPGVPAGVVSPLGPWFPALAVALVPRWSSGLVPPRLASA